MLLHQPVAQGNVIQNSLEEAGQSNQLAQASLSPLSRGKVKEKKTSPSSMSRKGLLKTMGIVSSQALGTVAGSSSSFFSEHVHTYTARIG